MSNQLPYATASLQQRLMGISPACSFAQWAVRMQPAETLTGDIALAWVDDQGQLNCFVADVVGHGHQAAIIGAMAISFLLRQPAGPCHHLLEALNEFLSLDDHSSAPIYCTGLMLSLDAKGQLSAASAGHPSALILGVDRHVRAFPLDHSAPMGLFGDTLGLSTESLQLRPHERILLLTDGLIERPTANEATKVLPESVLASILQTGGIGSIQDDADAAWLMLRALSQRHQQSADDQTLMLLEYLGDDD